MDQRSKKVIAEIEILAQPLLASEGVTLIDIECRRESFGRTLRVIIDKHDGVTLDDCTEIGNQLGDLLDAKLNVYGPYNMEISSPGLNFRLTKPRHFLCFEGRQVAIRLDSAVGGKEDFRGTLKEFSDGMVTLVVGQEIVAIAYENIITAHLNY